MCRIFLTWTVYLYISALLSQTYEVKGIEIIGNKRTQEKIVLNEIAFSRVSQVHVDDIPLMIEQSQDALMRTTLFTEVDVGVEYLDTKTQGIVVHVNVKELWPLYIYPKIDFLDRNSAIWISEHNASLDRAIIGLKAEHINLTGRADPLEIEGLFGFRDVVKLDYRLPPLYSANNRQLFMRVGFEYFTDKDIGIDIIEDEYELVRIRSEEELKNEFNASTGIIYRFSPQFFADVNFIYNRIEVADTVISTTPDYFTSQIEKFGTIESSINYENVDNRLYPLKGMSIKLQMQNKGLWNSRINNTFFKAEWLQSVSNKPKKLTLRNKLSFASFSKQNSEYFYFLRDFSKELSDFRSYERLFVVGQRYTRNSTQALYKLFNKDLPVYPKFMRKYIEQIPLRAYAAIKGDVAWIQKYEGEQLPLANEWIMGSALGLDFIVYNSFIFSIDYNISRGGTTGFILGFDTSF